MRKEIPAPVIGILADNIPYFETHATIDNLFSMAGAPGEPPEGSKPTKVQAWLRSVNKETDNPLSVLGKIVEQYMEIPEKQDELQLIYPNDNKERKELKQKIQIIFSRCNLTYFSGGIVSDTASTPTKSLEACIRGRDIPTIEMEFNRAIEHVNSDPRESVSAACNILESVFKVYIEDEGLDMPQKKDIQNVWKVVRADLGFEPSSIEDEDLRKILSGMFSVVDGIGALRTHASSAHGQGRRRYRLKPRHARLAINSAHTLALFVLETWDERRRGQ